ncbi:Aspercryptin biosynthesis cluster-specific transcription regulator [Fulvia fulva]|nr:Aspercryptin biosynthesis cluster-specific transcription regulator [Fulvia fulva]WPV12551.1 Aspercryptin biosynthesis cluster-specific transcription regulator [Fulvia fulva]WPV27501.1 Aspercryptin biosynthesis cluster-specific transcription regulator [Fulvia fulva]
MANGARKRVVTSKPSRNGCRTCRIRKVKCDEGRPVCHKCSSTGRTCDGYEVSYAPRCAPRRAILPARSSSSLSPIGGSPSMWINLPSDLSDVERHGYQFFLINTAPVMQLTMPVPQWVLTVILALQVGPAEPAVFYASAALGTMQRAIPALMHTSFLRPLDADLHELATRQYVKAMSSLRTLIRNADTDTSATRLVLIVCMLCTSFEVFRSRHSAAMDHTRRGCRIAIEQGDALGAQGDIWRMAAVTNLLKVSAVATATGAMPDGQKEDHDSQCCSEYRVMPSTNFETVDEAARSLHALSRMSEHLRSELLELARSRLRSVPSVCGLSQGAQYCLATCLSRTIPISNNQSLRLTQLNKAHARWLSSYDEITADGLVEGTRLHPLLPIKHFFSSFTLSQCRNTVEECTDFGDILDLIEQYTAMTNEEPTGFPPGPTMPYAERIDSFSMGANVLPALDLICYKCREPTIRPRALTLMFNIRRREGLDHSETLGIHALVTAEIEKDRALRLTGSHADISADARFCDVVHAGSETLGVYHVFCARYVADGSGEIEVEEYGAGAVPLRLLAVLNMDRSLCVRSKQVLHAELLCGGKGVIAYVNDTFGVHPHNEQRARLVRDRHQVCQVDFKT